MSKILISFLGTGALLAKEKNAAKESKSPREYMKANYCINNENIGDYSFVSLALDEKFHFDKIFLIGTPHSMWEEVYNQFKHKKNPLYDLNNPDDVYYELLDKCSENNYKSDLIIPYKDEVEAVLPSGSKIVLIRYGITEDEIRENRDIVLDLANYVGNSDEVMIDVTHSFRSLPILAMQLIMYLRTINAEINISHIFYGMLEVTRELGHTPIVDLKSVIEVNDWITGAYSFIEFGNAYRISSLMENIDKDTSNKLKNFSDAMNLNNLIAIQKQSQILSGIKNKSYNSKLADLVVHPTIGRFIKEFGAVGKQSVFQLRLSEWEYLHKNYCASYMAVIESILTYVCELNPSSQSTSDFDKKENAKNILRGKVNGNYPQGLSSIYFKLKDNRNSLAHSLTNRNDCGKMINDLGKSIKELKKIIK